MDFTTEAEIALAEIESHYADLHYLRHQLRSTNIRPSEMVIPARLRRALEGQGPHPTRSTLFGVPVMWSENEDWGIAVLVPKEKT